MLYEDRDGLSSLTFLPFSLGARHLYTPIVAGGLRDTGSGTLSQDVCFVVLWWLPSQLLTEGQELLKEMEL